MGAWAAGSFDNDDALDWFAELEAEGLPAAGGALQDVLDLADEYLEAPVCSAGLAAAEIVAALRGHPAEDLPEQVTALLTVHPGEPGRELVTSARRAVEAIASDSELAELWSDSSDGAVWQAAVSDLQRRLM